jgi:ABC-type multidrug transport system ATPase subunit
VKLETFGVGKIFGDGTAALRGIDLVLERGVFGLLGPNGAGKTTLLSIIVLELQQSSGSLAFDGNDPADPVQRVDIRSRIGYLPQDYEPTPYLTGREYLEYCGGLRLSGLRPAAFRRRAAELLERVGLNTVADKRCGKYSGGMRRRLGVAQALLHQPDLVVVDEPTAGLDPAERVVFRNLISDISTQATVLLSTHIVEDIAATSSRVGVIESGRLLFDGSAEELVRSAPGETSIGGENRVRSTLDEAYASLLQTARGGGA